MQVGRKPAAMTFADELKAGLIARPKTLPTKYLYDDLGSALFEVICRLPEYYLTRAEAAILQSHAQEIIDAVGGTMEIVELGSGTAVKTRLLLDAALRRQPTLRYRPIDISASAVEETVAALNHEYPNITVDALTTDYLDGLTKLSPNGVARRLVLFLGSNIGNFEPPEARKTMLAVRHALQPGDTFLMGVDLRKDREILERAYNDTLGVTAAFNKNLLLRINRELGGHFDLAAWSHRAWYNDAESRVEMHLTSDRKQAVAIDAVGESFAFEKGETIHTESSYKYVPQQIERLARDTGFEVSRMWNDSADNFSSNLLRAV
jgi:L-histidine Nalpha-methyltransferase